MSVWAEFTNTLVAVVEEQRERERQNDLDLRVTVRSSADADWDDNSWPANNQEELVSLRKRNAELERALATLGVIVNEGASM